MWFPHAFIGVMEQLQHAVETGTAAGALRRRQRQDDGARRGRLPLDRRGPHRQALRNRDLTEPIQGGTTTMMQAGIFTGYFPYGLEETAQEDPRARLQHRAARPALQGRRPVGRARSPRTRRSRSATRSATTTCRSAASRATPTSSIPTRTERDKPRRLPQGDHPQRPPLRHALRDLRDRHLQHRVRLGAPPEEQDRGRLRGVPQGHRRPRADRLRPRRGVPARDLRQQRRRLGRGDGEDVRAGRPSRASAC